MIDKIRKILEGVDRKAALNILSELVGEDYELPTAGSMIKKDCEPWLTKEELVQNSYSEGNTDAGLIDLSLALGLAEEILNCYNEYGDIEFKYFVRRETEEEMEEEGHDENIEWYTEDERIAMEDLQIEFEIS